jgi:hypothetical protein
VHEHEAGEREHVARAARSDRGAPEHRLLTLQRQAGNAAVTQHVQRADVEIDEMSSNVRTTDGAAPMDPGTAETVEGAVHDAAHPSDEQSGPTTLPAGGHATQEQEEA